MSQAADDRSYDGLPGAFPYAFRRSGSLLFKCYVGVGLLLTLFISVLFALALISLIANTVDATSSGTVSLMRAFFVLVGLLTVLPILAPILFVARRHRRNLGDDVAYDRRLAISGFLFLVSIYLALVVSTPAEQRVAADGALGPILEALYALPSIVGLVPPVVAALVIYWTHRLSR